MRKDVRPKPTKRQRLIEWGITVVMLGILGLLIIGPPWKRFMPPEGMETIDDLIGALPETYRFAAVEYEGTPYVVWVGRPRGPIVSGPPVCVFDTDGRLVDWSGDTGDSNNRFVREMHSLAFRSNPICVDEAIAICRPWRDRRRPGPEGRGVAGLNEVAGVRRSRRRSGRRRRRRGSRTA